MAKRKFVPVDLSRASCARCGTLGHGALVVSAAGTRAGVQCEACGEVVMGKPEAKRKRCSLGWAVVVPYLAYVDEHPEVLATGLPVFTADEWALLPKRPPAEFKRVWRERTTAIAREHEARKADPSRTIATGAPEAPQTPAGTPDTGDW